MSSTALRRILLVAPQPFYAVRGTPMSVLQMCRVLTGAGYAVDLATYPLGREVTMEGLRIFRAPPVPGLRSVPIGFSWRKVLLDSLLLLRVLGLLLRRRYAAVHAIEEAAFLLLPLTWLGVRLIYDLDSEISHQLSYSGAVRSRRLLAVVRAVERLTLRRSVGALTVCRALTERARGLAPGTPVFQVDDTPLEEMLRPADPRRVEELRGELELGSRPVAVYTGNLEPYQGIDLLLAAVPELLERLPEAALVVVGGEGEHLDGLRAEVSGAGLERHVRAVGRRPSEEMPEWMALGQALVSPRREGQNIPFKLYVYMWSGVPIVATDLPMHTQVLEGSSAFLCAPTAAGLGAALAAALGEPEAARARAAEARRRMEAEFSFESFRRKLLGAYGALLGEVGPAPSREGGR